MTNDDFEEENKSFSDPDHLPDEPQVNINSENRNPPDEELLPLESIEEPPDHSDTVSDKSNPNDNWLSAHENEREDPGQKSPLDIKDRAFSETDLEETSSTHNEEEKTDIKVWDLGLRLLLGSVKSVSLIAFAFLATLLLILRYPPEPIKRFALQKIQEVVFTETTLPLSLPNLETKSLLNLKDLTLTLKDIQLYGHPMAKEPVAHIPKATLKLNLWAYLTQEKALNTLVIDSAKIKLTRDKNGKLNLQPWSKPKNKKPKQNKVHPFIPSIEATFKNTQFEYQDTDPKYPLKSKVTLPQLKAKLEDSILYLNSKAQSSLAAIDLDSQLNIWEGQGQVKVNAQSHDLKKMMAYALRVKGIALHAGKAKVEAKAQWKDYKLQGLTYAGTLEADQLKTTVPFYKGPVFIKTRIHFDQNEAEIAQLLAQTGSSQVSLTGKIHQYLKPEKLNIKTRLKTHPLNLNDIAQNVDHQAIKAFRDLSPKGYLHSDLSVSGPLKTLLIKGSARLPQGQIRGINVRQARTSLSMANDIIRFSGFRGNAFKGTVQASGTVNLKTQQLKVSSHFQGLDTVQAKHELKLKIPKDYSPTGRISGQAEVYGPFKYVQVKGRFSSPQLRFPSNAKLGILSRLNSTVSYTPREVKVAAKSQSSRYGPIKTALTLKALDQLNLQVNAPSVQATSVNPWLKDPLFQQGHLSAKIGLNGSLKRLQRNWQSFRGGAQITGKDLAMKYAPASGKSIQQSLELFELNSNWNHGVAQVKHIELKENESNLKGSGKLLVHTLLGKSKNKAKAILMNLDGDVELQDFPLLKTFDVQKGKVHVDLKTHSLDNGNVRVVLKSQAKNMKARGVKLDSIDFNTAYQDQKLLVKEVKMAHQGQSLALKGEVNLKNSEPEFDLNAHTKDFKLQTILALLPPDIAKKIKQKKGKSKTPQRPENYFLPELKNNLDLQLAVKEIQDPSQKSVELPVGSLMVEHQSIANGVKAIIPIDTEAAPPGLDELWKTLEGQISLDLNLKGTTKVPDLKVQTLIEGFKMQDIHIPETYLKAEYKENSLSIDHFHMFEEKGGVIQAKGSIAPQSDSNIEFSGDNIHLSLAKSWYQSKVSKLEGKMSFLGAVKGDIRSPEVIAEFGIDDMLYQNYFFDSIQGLADYSKGYLKDVLVNVRHGDQHASAFGNMPLKANAPIDMSFKLENESFGLMNLFTKALSWQSGKGSALVHLGGTLNQPELEGNIALQEAKIYVPSLKESLTDISGKAELISAKKNNGNPPQIKLKYFKGKLGGGTASVKGTMDIYKLRPSVMDLDANLKNITIKYRRPGTWESTVPIESAKVGIKGLPTQPYFVGSVRVGKGGELYMPFIRSQKSEGASYYVSEEEEKAPARFYFGGLKVFMPEDFKLHSPIFDVDITSKKGIKLRHKQKLVTFTGNVEAQRGKVYLLNNVLDVEELDVSFSQVNAIAAEGINPELNILTSFPVPQGDRSVTVKARMKGTLKELKENKMRFEFLDAQGITDTEILAHLSGKGAFDKLRNGDITQVAGSFSDVFLRNIFNPVTSTVSRILGFEDFSIGLQGQSEKGEPIFNFNVRSKPFFFLQDELNLSSNPYLSFLDRIRLNASGQGGIGSSLDYEVNAAYQLSKNWDVLFTLGNKSDASQNDILGSGVQVSPEDSEQFAQIPLGVEINGRYNLDKLFNWVNFKVNEWAKTLPKIPEKEEKQLKDAPLKSKQK